MIFDDHSKLQFICNSAFRECSSLQNITIPSNVKTINDHSFNSCKSIKNITILSYPNIIGKSSFEGCSSLSKFMIVGQPSNENEKLNIKQFAFYNCKAITDISIPKNTIYDPKSFDDIKKVKFI